MAAMIPPSGMMVIFCTFSDVSLGKFLIGGIIPGILSVILYMVSIYVRAVLFPHMAPPVTTKTSWLDKIISLRFLFAAFLTFAVLLGGIYYGIFSPTEGGAAGAFVVFLIVLFRGRFNKENLKNSFMETVSTSAMIFFIIIGAMIFSQFLAVSRVPSYFIDIITGSAIPASLTVILILLMYILLGTFLDAVAMMALTLPIVYPMIESLGVNGLWFGIMVILMTEIALITPPLGLNVYVVKGVAPDDIKLEDIFLGIFPFLFMNLFLLALIFIFPSIATWLPSGMH